MVPQCMLDSLLFALTYEDTNANMVESRYLSLYFSLTALLNFCIPSSDWDLKIALRAFKSAPPQADGPQEQPSLGIANDSTCLLYKDH